MNPQGTQAETLGRTALARPICVSERGTIDPGGGKPPGSGSGWDFPVWASSACQWGLIEEKNSAVFIPPHSTRKESRETVRSASS